MNFRYLNIAFPLLLSACSIQVSGMQNAYQTPANSTNAATLTASANTKIISIDGKSIDESRLNIMPGSHQITLYAGKNNYQSDVNVMYVLTAQFSANQSYILKATSSTAWIQTDAGRKTSSVISRMNIEKSIRF